MKYGMNLLLWTAGVTAEHFPLLNNLKEWGFDGVELPMFDFDVNQYAKIGAELKKCGMESTAVTVCPADQNPISPDAAIRAAALARLKKAIEINNSKGAHAYRLSLSVGIAFYDPEHPCSIEELLVQADKSMYERKRNKQNS